MRPNRSAWIPGGGVFSAKPWQSRTSELFLGFLELLKQHVAGPLRAAFDNASIHVAKRIHPFVDLLKRQGLTFSFVPTYSPELNQIEKL